MFLSNIYFPCKINSTSTKNRNTELTASKLMDKLLPALVEEKYAIRLFLDYSASIDVLSHSILYDKFEINDIRRVSLDFIKVSFAKRSQYVCHDAIKSSIRCQQLGVIQGTKEALYFSISILVQVSVLMMKVYSMQT